MLLLMGKVFSYYKKKLCGPFLWMGFNCVKARATSRRQFTFYHYEEMPPDLFHCIDFIDLLIASRTVSESILSYITGCTF